MLYYILGQKQLYKDLILDLRFDPDTPIIIVLIKESKVRRWVSHEVSEKIVSIPIDKFFDYQGYVEEDIVWWSFKIKDIVNRVLGDMRIWT